MPRIIDAENSDTLQLCSQEEIIDCIAQDDVKKLDSLNYTLEMFYQEVEGAPLCHHLLNKNAVQILKYLLENQLNVHTKDKDSATMLHYVSSSEQAKFLLEAGAKVEAKDNEGETVIHTLTHKFFYDREALIYLLENGANVNAENDQRDTPLHIAARQDDCEIIKVLIDYGANLNIKNNHGQSALDIATSKTNQYMIELEENIKREGRQKMRELESRLTNLEKLVADLQEILAERQSPVSTARRTGLFKV